MQRPAPFIIAIAITLAALSTPAHSQSAFSIEAGLTYGSDQRGQTDGIRVDLDAESAPAFILTAGQSTDGDVRMEAEVSYARHAHSGRLGPLPDVDTEYDVITFGANVVKMFETQSGVRPELGFGLGWAFVDEVCADASGTRVCADVDADDWNLQAIAGLTWRVSDRTELLTRYRMQHLGGLGSEDRAHLLTFGARFEM